MVYEYVFSVDPKTKKNRKNLDTVYTLFYLINFWYHFLDYSNAKRFHRALISYDLHYLGYFSKQKADCILMQ